MRAQFFPKFGPGSGSGVEKVPGKFVIPSVKVQVRIILVSALCQQKIIIKQANLQLPVSTNISKYTKLSRVTRDFFS